MKKYTTNSQFIKPHEAKQYRLKLVELGLFPTANIEGDPDWDYHLESIDQLLPEIIQSLKPNDLVAIYRLAQALVIHDVDDFLFDEIQQNQEWQRTLTAKIDWVKQGGSVCDFSPHAAVS